MMEPTMSFSITFLEWDSGIPCDLKCASLSHTKANVIQMYAGNGNVVFVQYAKELSPIKILFENKSRADCYAHMWYM